jgi:spore maturation protein CgeB
MVVFRSQEELISLVEYYLTHDTEREALAHRAMVAVLARHTYDHRIAEMFAVVNEVAG